MGVVQGAGVGGPTAGNLLSTITVRCYSGHSIAAINHCCERIDAINHCCERTLKCHIYQQLLLLLLLPGAVILAVLAHTRHQPHLTCLS